MTKYLCLLIAVSGLLVSRPGLSEGVPDATLARACHRKLLANNVTQLLQSAKHQKSDASAETIREATSTLKRLKASLSELESSYRKKAGAPIAYSACDEKQLQNPITVQPETGQLIISSSEEDF